MHVTSVHRLTAVSKKCFTDGGSPFFFPADRLINQAQVVPHLCTFKDTQIHTATHSLTPCTSIHMLKLQTQSNICPSNFVSESFPVISHDSASPSLPLTTSRPPVPPHRFAFLPSVYKAQSYQQPQTVLVFFFPREHTHQSPYLPNNHSYCAPHCAEPTLSNAADG